MSQSWYLGRGNIWNRSRGPGALHGPMEFRPGRLEAWPGLQTPLLSYPEAGAEDVPCYALAEGVLPVCSVLASQCRGGCSMAVSRPRCSLALAAGGKIPCRVDCGLRQLRLVQRLIFSGEPHPFPDCLGPQQQSSATGSGRARLCGSIPTLSWGLSPPLPGEATLSPGRRAPSSAGGSV